MIRIVVILVLILALLVSLSVWKRDAIEDFAFGAVSTPTSLTTGGNATPSSSDTSASFSPTGNGLLLVCSGTVSSGSASTHSVSDTCTGTGSWSQVTDTTGTTRGSLNYAQLGATPGSCTVTITYGGVDGSRKSWIVAEVTGHDTTTPVAESGSANGSASTLSVSLSDIASGALAYGCIVARGDSDGITAGTNETELAEISSGGSAEARSQSEYGTDATVNWSDLAAVQNAGAAIEISQAAPAGAPQIIMISLLNLLDKIAPRVYAN